VPSLSMQDHLLPPVVALVAGARRLGIRGGILFLFFSLTISCARQRQTIFHGVSPGFRVKGTYYFQPKAAINNFWAWVDFEQAKADFRQLNEDGFNTIILLIPWGLFQPSIHPITYNELAFQLLDQMLSLADSRGLKVILRVGSHDYVPRGAGGVRWMAATVLADDSDWAAYRDLFREVAARTRRHSNLLAVFWTFEDAGYTPDPWLHRFPANVAAFRRWLRGQPLESWNQLWGENNTDYDTIQPPDQHAGPQNEKKLRSFGQFADALVVSRMPDACAAVQQGNPDLLMSFQPRSEINWGYDYSAQFRLPRCYRFVTTWFSPYQSYLFGEKRKDLGGRRVAGYVPAYVERTRQLSKGLPVFVDQFNFRHFGGYDGESALAGEKEELEFISNGLPPLLHDALGYALWNFQDYYLNLTYNGSFRFGLDEWEAAAQPAHVEVRDAGPGGAREVEIQPGGSLRQRISVSPGEEYTLEFQGNAASTGQTLDAQIHFLSTHQRLTASFPLSAQKKSFQWKIKAPPMEDSLTITFLPGTQNQAIRIGSVLFYPWVDTGGLYTVEGHPRERLRDLLRKINHSNGN
jgi:hypothetical protein